MIKMSDHMDLKKVHNFIHRSGGPAKPSVLSLAVEVDLGEVGDVAISVGFEIWEMRKVGGEGWGAGWPDRMGSCGWTFGCNSGWGGGGAEGWRRFKATAPPPPEQ